MRRRPPAEVVDLAGKDKPLAWALASDGWVVGTRERIHLPGREALGWQEVVRAAWDEPVLEVQLPGETVRLVFDDAGRIPEVVNERVRATVVVQHHVPLRADKGVRIVARRTPGGTDITWRVTFDTGLDPRDPELRRQADDALAELRANIGL